MSRRIWTGIIAGVLAAMVLLAVGIGAYRAGQHHEVVSRVASDGEVVRVIDGHGWGYGPGPGFFLFPLLGILLVVLLVRGFRGGGGGWHPPYGPGPWAPAEPESAFRDWHQRAHQDDRTEPATSPADRPG